MRNSHKQSIGNDSIQTKIVDHLVHSMNKTVTKCNLILHKKINTLKFSSGLGNIKYGLRSSSGDFSGVATGALSYVSM